MDRPGRAARWCIGVVDRYQASGGAQHYDGRCPYDPSCSTFLRETFATRAFPLAFAAATWRLLRCNPLVSARASDPVRARRRPNSLRTAFSLTFLVGSLFLMIAPAAMSQSLEGDGCQAKVNGRNPPSMTFANPVVVQKGGNINVRGDVPPGFSEDTQSLTNIKIVIVDDLFEWNATRESHPGNGVNWGGSVQVDRYFRVAGTYKVAGEASGSDGGRSFKCRADGYIKVDEAPLSTPIAQAAAGLTLVSGAGAVASRLGGKPKEADLPPPPTSSEPSAQMPTGPGWYGGEYHGPTADDYAGRPRVERGGTTCCVILPMLLLLPVFPVTGMAGSAAAPPAGPTTVTRSMWQRGHAVLGFIFGLLFGIGLTVLLQQFSVWPLTIPTAVVFPLAVALFFGIRSWVGTRFKVTYTPVARPPAPPPPPPPPAPEAPAS